MAILALWAGFILVGVGLWDIFHTMVLPRTFATTFRLTGLFYRLVWPLVSAVCRRLARGRLRDSVLATFGPFSLIGLIIVWASLLIVGFALIQLGIEIWNGHERSFARDLYLSGTTFFTLGLGDEKPIYPAERASVLIEAGLGFGTLAVVVGYLPVLYQSFSRRELEIALLASRAGHPGTAEGLLVRLGRRPDESRIISDLVGYERWCAEIMENHSSYPTLTFYRSQNESQSWLAALTMVLDACAVLQIGFDNHPEWDASVGDQAELTFAMGCRALAKLSGLVHQEPATHYPDRLRVRQLRQLEQTLADAGLRLRTESACLDRLVELRQLYEPYVFAFGRHLLLDIPPFVVGPEFHEPTTPEAAVREAIEVL